MKAFRFLRALPLAMMLLAAPVRAEQGTIVGPVSGPMTMTSLMGIINASFLAIQSCNSGSSAPANGVGGLATHYQCWADTTTNPVVVKMHDGASWAVTGKLNTTTHLWTPSYQGTDLGTASTATTGTSGHTVPFLDGINTWSGANNFGMNLNFPFFTGTGGSPATSGTTSTALARVSPSATNTVLDMGVKTSGGFETWLQATDRTNLSIGSGMLLNPNGGGVAINAITPASGLNNGLQIGTNWTNTAPFSPLPGSAYASNGGLTVYGIQGTGTGIISYSSSSLIAPGGTAQGMSSYVFANNAAQRGAWSFYGECHVITAADNCSAVEVSGINRVAAVGQFDPFASFARVGVIGIDCGNSVPSATYAYYNCDVAINIVQNAGAGNTSKFTTGISFANNSLDTSGGAGRAISMIDNYALTWYSALNTISGVFTANTASGFVFTKGATNILVANSGAAGIQFPQYGTGLLHSSSVGVLSSSLVVSSDMNITTTSCTNQFVSAISSGGVGTCTTDILASAQHANQGTATTVLHGNAAGNPSWSAISLTADVSGALPSANGGTGLGTATVVGTLPTCNAGTKAARYFVTDANATFTAGIGAIVAAGGANNVPVTCDGTNWRIGADDNIPLHLMRKYA